MGATRFEEPPRFADDPAGWVLRGLLLLNVLVAPLVILGWVATSSVLLIDLAAFGHARAIVVYPWLVLALGSASGVLAFCCRGEWLDRAPARSGVEGGIALACAGAGVPLVLAASLVVPSGGVALPWQTAWADANQPVDGGWLLLGLGLTLAALQGLLGLASRRARRAATESPGGQA